MKKLGFGFMRLPLLEGEQIDVETVKVMADEFIARGFTYFDTAAPYHQGHSEEALRQAVVERYPREAYTITDKLSLFMVDSAEALPGFFDAQLERLGVDYLDYYLLHGLSSSTYRQAEELGAFDFIKKLKDDGRVRHIGMSFHDNAEVLDEILTAHPELDVVQLQLNYLDWEDAAVQSHKCYDTVTRHGKPVLVMEPVKGGNLAKVPAEAEAMLRARDPEASNASWAIRFAASLDNVMMVLSGMSSPEQVDDNTSFMRDFKPLTGDEVSMLEKCAEIIRGDIAIPCTGCRYCVDGCPMHIAIPECFSLYNYHVSREGKTSAPAMYYETIIKDHGKASDCIKCGQCEERCPQHLPIRDYLEKAAEILEK